MASRIEWSNRTGKLYRRLGSLCYQGMNSLCRCGWVFVLAVLLSVGAAGAAPEAGQGKAPPPKGPRRAAQQARKEAKRETNAARMQGRSGPNARAGTPRPAPGAGNAPRGVAQPGGQTGANARAGTPRQAAPQQIAPSPAAVPQAGGRSGANARAGTGGQAQSFNPAQRPQQPQTALPAGWQQKLQQMSPEERERFLQNNEKFRSLPPEQQNQIRQNLSKYDQLSPKQQASMNRNAEALAKLTPQQRDALRTQVLPQWRQMTPERRQELKQRLNSLNGLSDAERQQRLNDPNFYQGLSPQEHNVLKQLGEDHLTPGGH